ncbi:MAG: DUF4139 domain-containing protein, partial [Candidatus Eiseniibacteriota bacterium]
MNRPIAAEFLALPILLAAALAVAAPASAEERPVMLDSQTGVAVTIYNGDLALVKDQRTVRLDQGRNTLGFVDVS